MNASKPGYRALPCAEQWRVETFSQQQFSHLQTLQPHHCRQVTQCPIGLILSSSCGECASRQHLRLPRGTTEKPIGDYNLRIFVNFGLPNSHLPTSSPKGPNGQTPRTKGFRWQCCPPSLATNKNCFQKSHLHTVVAVVLQPVVLHP